jgi:hypothetical protein
MDMDVERSRSDGHELKNGAQRSFFVNVIARGDDRAMTIRRSAGLFDDCAMIIRRPRDDAMEAVGSK